MYCSFEPLMAVSTNCLSQLRIIRCQQKRLNIVDESILKTPQPLDSVALTVSRYVYFNITLTDCKPAQANRLT